MPADYFADAYVRLLFRFIQQDQPSEACLFRGTNLTGRKLLEPSYRVDFSSQMQLCENAVIRNPGLGLKLGVQLQLASHGVLGTALQNASDLTEALDTFLDFVPTRASFYRMERVERGETTTLFVDVAGLSKTLVPFFTEAILAALQHCIIFYTGRTRAFSSYQLAFEAPAYAEDYATVFGTAASFDVPRTSVSFPSSFLSAVTHEPDRAAFVAAVARCREDLKRSQGSDDTLVAVHYFLRANPGTLWSADEVAEAMHMSKRTFLRRLKSQGCGYQSLRDEVLYERSRLLLASLTVAETAAALGFADESSFRRSYRRWSGRSPRAQT